MKSRKIEREREREIETYANIEQELTQKKVKEIDTWLEQEDIALR